MERNIHEYEQHSGLTDVHSWKSFFGYSKDNLWPKLYSSGSTRFSESSNIHLMGRIFLFSQKSISQSDGIASHPTNQDVACHSRGSFRWLKTNREFFSGQVSETSSRGIPGQWRCRTVYYNFTIFWTSNALGRNQNVFRWKTVDSIKLAGNGRYSVNDSHLRQRVFLRSASRVIRL